MRPHLALAACVACAPAPRDGVLSGVVTATSAADSDPVARARVRTFDAANAAMDDVKTDEDGRFEAAVPWAGGFFVQLDHDSAASTTFSILSVSGAVEGGPGDLWLRTPAEVEALRETFSTCPTVDAPGAIVEGEVRVYLPVEQVEDLPTITTGVVTLVDPTGKSHTACYLDGRSNSDPDAEVTGGTGRFAFFGLPEGVGVLQVSYWIDEEAMADTGGAAGLIDGGTLPVRLVEGGVSPHYPFWALPPQ